MTDASITVFACNRGGKTDTVKVQLEIPKRILESAKRRAKELNYTPKQLMERVLIDMVDDQ